MRRDTEVSPSFAEEVGNWNQPLGDLRGCGLEEMASELPCFTFLNISWPLGVGEGPSKARSEASVSTD